MKYQITTKDINEYSKCFNSNDTNRNIMKGITTKGLQNFCLNQKIINQNPPMFNIELSETKRENQKASSRCWIYSVLNFIKRNMSENLNINPMNFSLSPTFISFFDRLEKSNSLYNTIISKNINFKSIDKYIYLSEPCHEKGRFENFKVIVNKYGLVPYDVMQDTKDTLSPESFNLIFNEKVKKDCVKLLNAKKQNIDCYELKKKFLEENYDFLSKIMGEPPSTFTYTYTNKQNEQVILSNISPMQFKNKYLTIKLNDYIPILNMEKYNRQLFKKYRKKGYCNIYKKSRIEYLNLPIQRLKELSIIQLKQGEPVIFDCEPLKYKDVATGVLDTSLYNYSSNFSFEPMTKIEALNFGDRFARHVMTLTGVHIESEKSVRWKAEDSYGADEKYNGYYIMNDNWFDNFVIGIVINKNYLSEKELDLYNDDAIITNDDDAF